MVEQQVGIWWGGIWIILYDIIKRIYKFYYIFFFLYYFYIILIVNSYFFHLLVDRAFLNVSRGTLLFIINKFLLL